MSIASSQKVNEFPQYLAFHASEVELFQSCLADTELGAAVTQIVYEGKSAKAVMDELAPKLQVKLDEVYNW